MPNDFDSAADAVGSKTDYAEAVYIDRKYPLPDEGWYTAMCVKSELKPSNSQYDAPGTNRIHLQWELMNNVKTGQPVSYVDPEDQEQKVRKFKVFSRALSIAFSDKAHLNKLMKTLTGMEPIVRERKEARLIQGETTPREITIKRFNHSMIEGMTAELKIVHSTYKTDTGVDKTSPSIEDYSADKETIKKNRALIPPEDMDYYEGKNGKVQEEKGPVVPNLFKEGENSATGSPVQEEQPVIAPDLMETIETNHQKRVDEHQAKVDALPPEFK